MRSPESGKMRFCAHGYGFSAAFSAFNVDLGPGVDGINGRSDLLREPAVPLNGHSKLIP